MAEAQDDPKPPQFNKAKHIAYWRRCHETLLPTAYTSNDSTRLTFAFFILAALDLLGVPLSGEDRAATRAWVLGLQHPDGGFCGSPTHAMTGEKLAGRGTANLAATFFALLLLGGTAGADTDTDTDTDKGTGEGTGKETRTNAPHKDQRAALAGVERGKTLRWLRRLQREDGSFGQVLWEGRPVGGWDMRHSYLAAGVRWMLGADEVDEVDEAGEDGDVDVERMVEHIRGVNTYDGGLSEAPQQESHAGYAYCAVAALAMLDRGKAMAPPALQRGVADRESLLKWLAHRQFVYRAEEEEQDDSEVNYVEAELGQMSLDDAAGLGEHVGGASRHVGFNGRWNKKADTCYAWWVGGTLNLLGSPGLFDVGPTRNYLLGITQHAIGGFAKSVGGLPDLYHSYLGLAALAMMGEEELKELDVGLCCSREMADRIGRARGGLLEAVARRRGGDRDSDEWATEEFWKKAASGAA